MKNYMKTMVEIYFIRNMASVECNVEENVPEEVLNRNSYTLLNVSPRFF